MEHFADLESFSQSGLLILTSLAGGPKHGYVMMDDIRRLASAICPATRTLQ